MFYKLALRTTCVFFVVNFDGNKKDLCILQRYILIAWSAILTSRDAIIKSKGFPILASREVNITFQSLPQVLRFPPQIKLIATI
jgi:hypothetical protein